MTDDRSANDRAGSFLITVDTEGDDLWAKPREITARNAEVLPRFQEMCERHGLKPTYLTNWEMVESPTFVEFGRDVLQRGTAEIGMHLHAWNSPPLTPLTSDDLRYQPFLIEYPEDVIRDKVRVMTDALESAFGRKMLSHRAGRWALDETYAAILVEAGYRVDCSVTPNKDWSRTLGDPARSGGPDYRAFPEAPYFMDPDDISRAGDSPLLQAPMTVMSVHESTPARALRASAGRVPYLRRIVHRRVPRYSWLQPVRNDGRSLVRILSAARRQQRDHVEFMVHSSELMAGGSPWFRTTADIDAVYESMEALFAASSGVWVGRTLSEYHDVFVAGRRPEGASLG